MFAASSTGRTGAIWSYWASWRKAVVAARCPARIPHDLRRTAVRHFDRCGIPRPVAMKLSGHLTESIYTRYNIAAPSDLQVAAARLDAMGTTS
jgi:integrase